MEFETIKLIHVGTVALSFGLFFLRGTWMIVDSPLLARRWVRVVPHVNDTLLLTAGVWLAVLTGQYPVAQTWLTAKVVALALYIGLGMLALRPRAGKRVRVAAWCAAQLVFVFIVAVAVTREPFGGMLGR